MKIIKNTKRSVGASTTLYVCIWLGLLVVSFLMDGSEYLTASSGVLQQFSVSPVQGVVALIGSAFSSNYFGMTILSGIFIVGSIAVTSLTGGNSFFVFFAIPLLMIMQLLTIFQPMTDSTVSDTGSDVLSYISVGSSPPSVLVIRAIFNMFLGALSLLTVYSFISGRP